MPLLLIHGQVNEGVARYLAPPTAVFLHDEDNHHTNLQSRKLIMVAKVSGAEQIRTVPLYSTRMPPFGSFIGKDKGREVGREKKDGDR